MPIIPRYGLTRVETAPLPAPRLSVDAPAEAFAPAAPPDISGATEIIRRMVEEEKERADRIALTRASSQLDEFQTELLYHPETGALNKRGRDALGIPEEVGDEWERRVAQITNELGSGRQRLLFGERVAQRADDLRRTVQRHVASESRAYDEQETKAFVANARGAAIADYRDAERIQRSIAEQRAALIDFARDNGLSNSAWLKEQLAEAASDTHVGVINRMLANGEDLLAASYHVEHRGEITGADAAQLEQNLQEGSVRGRSQRLADEIARKHDSFTAAREEASRIEDPKIRDATVERLRTEYNDRERDKNRRQEDAFIRATNLIDANPGRSARRVVPPHDWMVLTPQQRDSLESRASGVGDDADDSDVWLSFRDLSTDDMAALSRAEFESRYWNRLTRAHREEAIDRWDAAREGDPAKITSTLTFNQIVDNVIRETKIVPPGKTNAELTNTQKRRQIDFETRASQAVQQFAATQLKGARKASPDEMQDIIERLAFKTIFIQHPRFAALDPVEERLIDEIQPDERKNAFVEYDRIPLRMVTNIEAHIRERRGRVTESKVQRAFAAYLLRDQALLNRILSEK